MTENPSPPPAPRAKPQARRPASLSEKLLRFSFQKPAEAAAALGAVVAGLHTIFYGLGLVALAAREDLLGLASSLDYPLQKALLTSLHVLWALPWSMAMTPKISAGAAFSIILPAVLVGPLIFKLCERFPHRWVFRVSHGLVAILAFVCLGNLSAATHPPLAHGRTAPYFQSKVDASFYGPTQAEVISWLTNDNPEHPDRRQGFFGAVGWMVVFLAMMLQQLSWLRARSTIPRDSGIGFFQLAFVSLLLATLPLVPRAYAVAFWGIEYPRLQNSGAGTDLEGCCLYDVSAGGTPLTTLQTGEHCSSGLGFRTWTPEKAHDLLFGVNEVIRGTCK